MFKKIKQFSSFADYNFMRRELGTSVKEQKKISKKSNRYIRNNIYFPFMGACRFNPIMKEVYTKINDKNTSKMIGQVSKNCQFEVILYGNYTIFDTDYNKVTSVKTEATQDTLTK